MISYDANIIVAVSILSARLPIKDVVRALDKNIPIIGGDVTKFEPHHVDEVWEYMRINQPEWHTFARSLKDCTGAEGLLIDRGVEKVRNGCLHEWSFCQFGEPLTLADLDCTYCNIIESYGDLSKDAIILPGPEELAGLQERLDAYDNEVDPELKKTKWREYERYVRFDMKGERQTIIRQRTDW